MCTFLLLIDSILSTLFDKYFVYENENCTVDFSTNESYQQALYIQELRLINLFFS